MNADGSTSWETVDVWGRNSFVLAFGETGPFDEAGLFEFFIFALFSFFIPLTLMNMLIAIMADAYERVQSNAISADAKQLAEMEHEYEELMRVLLLVFKPQVIKQNLQYLFFTRSSL